MKSALSPTVSLMAKYIQKRPDSSQLQFVLRVPEDLLHRYPKSPTRYSLKTADPVLAAKRGEAAYVRHQAEFARLRGDSSLTPAQLNTLALEKAKDLGSLQHDDAQDYFQDMLYAWARKQGFKDVSQFEHLPEYRDDTYLDKVDREALRIQSPAGVPGQVHRQRPRRKMGCLRSTPRGAGAMDAAPGQAQGLIGRRHGNHVREGRACVDHCVVARLGTPNRATRSH